MNNEKENTENKEDLFDCCFTEFINSLRPDKSKKYSKLEAFADIISIMSYRSHDTVVYKRYEFEFERGQLMVDVAELARRWHWTRPSVKQFLSDGEKKGVFVICHFQNLIKLSFTDIIRVSLLLRISSDVLELFVRKFFEYLNGSLNADYLIELYQRYYEDRMYIARHSTEPHRCVDECVSHQSEVFAYILLAMSPLHAMSGSLKCATLMGASQLFGWRRIWDWYRVIRILELMYKSFLKSVKPSKLGKIEFEVSSADLKELDSLYNDFTNIMLEQYQVR